MVSYILQCNGVISTQTGVSELTLLICNSEILNKTLVTTLNEKYASKTTTKLALTLAHLISNRQCLPSAISSIFIHGGFSFIFSSF